MNLARQKKWEQHVADYKRRGKSAKAWCEANNENIHTLRYWVKKFHSEVKPELESKPETSTEWVKIDTFQPERRF